ncbi:hypothetical protein [Streptomyces sp. NBC_00343]|uniref:hypothetical protein n=1 Tax=Streptomyces sp. NBC_00343 TaxID=2975719 RepID=UPI002E2D510B|nr:hypothetical protein [Streptomyces sp. NBC_00343]
MRGGNHPGRGIPPTGLRVQILRGSGGTVRESARCAHVRLEPETAVRGRIGGCADRTVFTGRGLPQIVGRVRIEETVDTFPDDLGAGLP